MIFEPGNVGLISRSGTLTYEAVDQLTKAGLGPKYSHWNWRRSCDWNNSPRCCETFQDDPDTEAIVLIGEIGGSAEEEAAEYIKDNVDKACCCVYCRKYCSSRTPYGTCRRYYFGWKRICTR